MLKRLLLRPLCHPDPLPPDDGAPPPAAARRDSKLTCEHCECVLTPTGDVLRMSDRARDHNRQKETIAKKDETIAELEKEVRELRAKLTEIATVRESNFDLSF